MILVFIANPKGRLVDRDELREINRSGKENQVTVRAVDGEFQVANLFLPVPHGRQQGTNSGIGCKGFF